jgi:hypothetical protein
MRQIRTDLSLYDRSIAFLLVCFLFCAYLLTYTGVMQSSDGLAMFATTESIVRRGEVDANQLLWMGLQQGTFGLDGDLYSRKGAGMSLLAVPLVWLAMIWSPVGLVQAALLLNPLLTAWTGGLLYRAVIRLGWSRYVAIVTALAFGLATLAWPYTQTFFSDPVAAWGLFAALYSIFAYSQSGRKRYLFLGGAAWGVAYLARSLNLITLPIYVVAMIFLLYQRNLALVGAPADQRLPPVSSILPLIRRYFREWILLGLPILFAGLFSLWWNWLRYGAPFESGYLEVEAFSGDWLFGLFGLLIGPARGILWYSPVLLLIVWGMPWFWRHARWLLLACLGIALIYWLAYARWFMWHGGYSWGPRFLVPVLPFVMLLTAPVWQQIYEERRWGRLARAAVALLLILSLSVQWLGMLVPFSLVQNWLAQEVTPLFAPETFTQLRYSPLVLQWRYLTAEHLHFAWWQAGNGAADWLALGLITGAVLVGGWLITRQLFAAAERGEVLPNWIYGLALILVTLVLLVRYQEPLSGVTNVELAGQIQAEEKAGDAILHLRPEETQQFANAYHGRLPGYGLLPAEHLDEEEEKRLALLARQYRRLWVIPDYRLPERSGWERPLRGNAFLLLEQSLADGRRLALYALPHAQPLTEIGAGVRFGAPSWARLNGYGYTEATRAGGELLLVLEWESLQPVAENYQVFVHLLNESGARIAQRDGQPVLWLRPTSTWQPGERILDRYGILLNSELAPGRYFIAVGLYDPQSGERQPTNVGPGESVRLGPILVQP